MYWLRQFAFWLVALIWLTSLASAQQPSPSEGLAGPRTLAMWHVGIGYPQAITGGASVVLVTRRLPSVHSLGRRSDGLLVGAEGGVGGLSVRAGWAQIYGYDAGFLGWSVEALYLRTWVLEWGFPTGSHYVGGGASAYLGPLRFSSGLMKNTSSGRFAATMSASVVSPIH